MDSDSHFSSMLSSGLSTLLDEAIAHGTDTVLSAFSMDTGFTVDELGQRIPDPSIPISIFHHLANIQREDLGQKNVIGNGFIIPTELLAVLGHVVNPINQRLLPAEDTAFSILARELGYRTVTSNNVTVTNYVPELHDEDAWLTQLIGWSDVEAAVLNTYGLESSLQPTTSHRRQMMLAAAGRLIAQTFMHPDYKIKNAVTHIKARSKNHRRIFG